MVKASSVVRTNSVCVQQTKLISGVSPTRSRIAWFAAVVALITLSPRIASAADRPNILLIIFDDWSREHSGVYGCEWIDTPNFDRVASEGVRFTNFFTSNPKCSPCRASLLTGRNTWQLGSGAMHVNHFPADIAVYPSLMQQAGYHVGLTGKGWGPGDAKKVAGFKHNPAGPTYEKHRTTPPANGIANTDYAECFNDFLDQKPDGVPFCHWLGFKEPHRKYEWGSGEKLGIDPGQIDVPDYFPDTDLVRTDIADYAAEVEYCDRHIGRVLQTLEDRGELDNTLIAITSDHGMPFPYVKGQIHEDGFHLPLAIRWGNVIQPGRVVDDFVGMRDLAPTFLEAAGIEPASTMTGTSLLPILKSPASGKVTDRPDFALVGKERHDLGRPHDWGYPVRAIRTPQWLYVRNFHPERWPAGNPETDYPNCDPSPTKELVKALGGYYYDLSFGKRATEELYDLSNDPRGIINLANSPAHSNIVSDLRYQMMSELTGPEQDPRALGKGAIFDTYEWIGNRKRSYDAWLEKATKAAEESATPDEQQEPNPKRR